MQKDLLRPGDQCCVVRCHVRAVFTVKRPKKGGYLYEVTFSSILAEGEPATGPLETFGWEVGKTSTIRLKPDEAKRGRKMVARVTATYAAAIAAI